jgi:hypothetical protein
MLYALAPVWLYWTALIAQTILSVPQHGLAHSVCAFPLLFATHLFYGIGFWKGLFSRVNRTKPATTEVTLERMPLSRSDSVQ